MSAEGSEKEPQARSAGRFATTHWSVVLAASDRTSPRCREALSSLCQTYWYPLYAFARRGGAGAEDAQDLTQDFFARLLEKDTLRHVDPHKGRFRSFLLVSFKNFVRDQGRRARTQKRGGGQAPVPIDLDLAEGRFSREPSDKQTPETIFERRWALTLLERALDRLGEEYASSNRGEAFERLKGYLTGDTSSVPYVGVARDLGVTEVAVKVAVHRLRRRFRAALVEEIAQTVESESDVAAEIEHLFAALDR